MNLALEGLGLGLRSCAWYMVRARFGHSIFLVHFS